MSPIIATLPGAAVFDLLRPEGEEGGLEGGFSYS